MMKIKTIADSLIAIGESVHSKDLILHAITGLGEHYNAFVCNITNQASVVIVEEFHSRLLVYEHRLQQQDRDEEQQGIQANMAKFTSMNVSSGGNFS